MDLNEAIKQLTDERDALMAQVDVQQDVIKIAHNKLYILSKNRKDVSQRCLIDADKGFKAVDDYLSANKTPAQCLAEIKAKEAVKGWWACWEWVDSDDKDKPTLIPALNQYEAKVRQGGAE